MTDLDALARLPFQPQLAALAAWRASGRPLGALLEALAAYPDHEPLARTLRALAQGPASAFDEAAPTLRRVLPDLSDSALQRVLRALGHQDLDPEQLARASALMWEVWERLGLGRIAAFCLLDRWLKNADPATYHARQEALRQRLVDHLIYNDREAPDDDALLRASGRWLEGLRAVAASRGRQEAWEARLRGFSAQVLRALQRLPRSLSQANAEEILSKRIYTDPGHFLVELLQNAEDSGAARFWVGVEQAEAWVWHDGAPFDAKDVVGVLSIGQSTKGRGQIGFFGVGFKSVYEVCERPQVYSELFSFEIADVSIPREMGTRPQGPWPTGGTLLVLPWRAGSDDAPLQGAILQHARAIPPEVLLTLTHARELRVFGGGEVWSSALQAQPEAGEVALLVERGEERELRRYQTARGLVVAEPGSRERARAAQSEVLVAVRLDPQTGAPARVGRHEPLVYNHLPTREPSPLGWMIHAAFDQPVDRERLDLGSVWNRALLREAGRVAPQVFAALLERGCDGASLLDLIPTRDEAEEPAWLGLREALLEGVRPLTLLRSAQGALACHEARLVLDPALARALDGATWSDGRRCCDLAAALGASPGRRLTVARELGALALHPQEALDALMADASLLARVLEHRHDAWEPLHAWLELLPRAADLGLGAAPWFPVEGGGWASLRGPHGAWVAPAGPWGAWVRGFQARPPLALHAFSARFEGWLRRLGARTLDLETLVARVEAGELALEGPDRAHFHQGLAQMAQDVTPRQREALARARVWPRADGGLAPLDELRRVAGSEPLERVWRQVSARALWDDRDDAASRSLDALRLSGALAESSWPALWDALRAAPLRQRAQQPQEDAWARALRQGLAALGDALAPWKPQASSALAALPLWPTRAGGRAASSQVARGRSLRAELWLAGLALDDGEGALGWLADEAEDDAQALCDLLPFRSPVEAVLQGLTRSAQLGAPLSAQRAPLDTPEGVARLAAWLWPSLGLKVLELPLAVDLDGRLARAPRHRAASEDEAWVCELVGLRGILAEPRWATLAQGIDPRLTPPVPVGRVCAELSRLLRAGEAGALLDEPARLYRWIEARQADIERDEAALNTVGQAPLIKTEAGPWRSPRAVLWGADLGDDLGLEAWRCGPAVTPTARAWFEARFAWEESSLQGLMGALVELHKEAQSRQDGPRSARLWAAMAKALRAEQSATSDEVLGRAAERHKLHKLRVEGRDGGWERPGHFLSGRDERLDQALVAQVPVVHGGYEAQDAGVRRLLEAAGARQWWEADALMEAVAERRNLKPGLDAACALACYVARWLVVPPHAKHAPRLRAVAWVPTAAGALAPPSGLYWPGPDLEALLGDSPSRRPHPAFFHAAPTDARALLGFLDPREARVEDVLAPWIEAAGERPLPAAVLSWLEVRLRHKAVTGQELRHKLQGRAVFQDDEGTLRPPEVLICTPAKAWIGDQRAVWSQGLRWSKLAAELGVPRQVGVAEALAYGAWAENRLREQGPAGFLAEDGARLERIQRCTALLIERGAPARPDWPLAVVEPSGEASLRRLDDPALVLWSPARLVEEAERRGVAAPTPWLLDEAQLEEAERWFLAGGVKDLRAVLGEPVENIFVPAPQAPPGPPPQARKVPEHAKPIPPHAHTKAQPAPRQAPAQAPPATPATQAHADAPQAHEPKPQAPPAPAPTQAPAQTQEAPAEAEPASGLWGRVKRWFGGDERPPTPDPEPHKPTAPENKAAPPSPARSSAPQAPPTGLSAPLAPPHAPPARPKHAPPDPKQGAEPPPFKPSDHSRWFRPASSVEAQLEGAPSWVQDRVRRPEFGFSFRPAELPWPYKYAVKVLAGRFERATQRWLPSPAVSPAWLAGGAPLEGAEVSLRGRVPAGENVFPLPMYARWGQLLGGHAQPLPTRDGGLLLLLDHPQELSATLTLTAPPRFEEAQGFSEAPKELLEQTVPDAELPEEVLSWVAWLKDEGLPPLERAKAVQAFIQGRYRYDPSYLEDPQEARRRLRAAQGSAHLHLAAMHADRDARHLGRGVCHEFGALACELLRRVGVPAAVATGWTWDRGQLGEADHMWAMALLPSDLGPRWAPIDAATTREGRPLHHGARPPGGWTPPPSKGAAPLPQAPAWTQSPKQGRWDAPREQRRGAGPERARPSEPRPSDNARSGADPAELLALVVEHMAKQAGEPVPDDLRATCEAALADPDTARALWALLGLVR